MRIEKENGGRERGGDERNKLFQHTTTEIPLKNEYK